MAKDLMEIGKRMVADNLIKGEYRDSKNILLKSLSSCNSCPIADFCSITKLMKEREKKNGCREIRNLYKEGFEGWKAPMLQLRIRLADIKLKIHQQSIIDAEKKITMSKRMKMLLDVESRYIDKLMKYCPPDKEESKKMARVIDMSYEEDIDTVYEEEKSENE